LVQNGWNPQLNIVAIDVFCMKIGSIERGIAAMSAEFESIGRSDRIVARIEKLTDLNKALNKVAAVLKERAVETDSRGTYPHENLRTLHEAGLLGICLPKKFGGLGIGPDGDYRTFFDINDRLGAACSSTAQVFFVQNASLATLGLMATDAQMQVFADAVKDRGATFCYVGAEPTERFTKDGKRIFSETVAERTQGGWTINGRKAFATGSMGASYVIFYCMPKGADDAQRMMVMVLPIDAPGLKVIDSWNNMGQRATSSGMLEFHNCFVPDSMVIGGEGSFYESKVLGALYQLGFAALLTGIAQGALNFTIDYIKDTLQPTIGYDNAAQELNIQIRVAEMATEVEASRALVHRAAELLQQIAAGGATPFETMNAIYQAKTFATEMAVKTGAKLFQLCGARATSRRYGADRFWRDARTLSLHDNLDRQRGTIGRFVLGIENPSISTR